MTGGFNIELSNLQLQKKKHGNRVRAIPKPLLMGPLTQPLRSSTANTIQIKNGFQPELYVMHPKKSMSNG